MATTLPRITAKVDVDTQDLLIKAAAIAGIAPLTLSAPTYWLTHRHPKLLFPAKAVMTNKPMDRGGVQKAMKQLLKDCRINQPISPHTSGHKKVIDLLMAN